ncbi:MAG: ABC transporter permease subunit [Micromonosporaceae bacterium]
MRLVKAEWRRLFKRRITRVMLAIAVLVLGAVATGMWFSNQKVGPAELAAAEQRAQQEYQQSLESFRQHCAELQQRSDVDPRETQFCEDPLGGPQPEHFEAEWYLPPTFDFKREFPAMITLFAGVLALVGFVVGASFVGAEWHSGAMMNLLLWRPRRLQVLLTKLGTLLVGLLAVGLVLGAAWTAAFWAIGTYRGIVEGMTPGTWQSLALTGARGLGLMLIAAAVGFGIASLGRHTAMALGAVIGLVVVGFVGVGIVVQVLQVRFGEAYLWPTYLMAWMDKRYVIEDWRSCDFSLGVCQPQTLELTWQHSGLIFVAVTVLALGAAMWSMRRRDVA